LEYVQPIRDRKKIEAMKKYLKGSNLRDHCLFVLGIGSGLRISDLLQLKIEDVMTGKKKVKSRILLREKKTNKQRSFPISDNAKKAIEEYLATREYHLEEPLFISRKKQSALQRAQAYKVINDAAQSIGLVTKENKIGTHTLRKTFGYHAYQARYDLTLLQKIFNHSPLLLRFGILVLNRKN
jgi:integrase